MKYNNPIVTGFHPDPSICRVGDDYFLVTSSFEYFPGIPVFHSKNLVDWEQIGYCLTRNDQLQLMHGAPNGAGIYAPTIRYHNGTFYVIVTNVTQNQFDGKYDGNFIIKTKDPYGEWSDPVWLDCPGIDPSLFFDEDGTAYYCGTHGGIYLCSLDIATGKRTSERTYLWYGTGGVAPEGPHIYKIGGWYYLFISEGGTEYCHMITVARSKTITGPYEAYDHNPVLTNRSLDTSIKAVGHSDLVQDQNGNWWAVCLGIRPISYPFRHNLGRETMLVPVEFNESGWPSMGNNGMVEEVIETGRLPLIPGQKITNCQTFSKEEEFDATALPMEFNYIYNPVASLYSLSGNGGLDLYGNGVPLSIADSLAWVGRRQEHIKCMAKTCLHFPAKNEGEEAGLTIYMNNLHHYEIALTFHNGKRALILRRQIGSLWKIEQEVPYEREQVIFKLDGDSERYCFSYSIDGTEYAVLGQGETKYLTTEVGGVFTGNYIAMYATGNGCPCKSCAHFSKFEYKGF